MITAEEAVVKKRQGMISVEADTVVADALGVMNRENIGAVLVTENGAIAGIWTERDLMRNTLQAGFDPMRARIGDYMSRNLKSVPHTHTVYQMMDSILGLRIRHLLVRKDGAYIGLLSSGDVMRAALQDKTEALREVNEMVSWDYYESWQWGGAQAAV